MHRRVLVLAAALAIAAPAFGPAPARAHDYRAGDLAIAHPWARATTADVGAGYLGITNGGSQPDRLLGATSPVARVVELHTMSMTAGVMRMRPVAEIVIAPGATLQLRPGGLHMMIVGLSRPLRRGERVPVTLRFERAGSVAVELAVEAPGAQAPAAGGHGH